MKICQVATGLIPIPNNRWGAVEKVIGYYNNHLIKRGHKVDIKYLNDIDKDEYDIVHIHMANLCIEAKKRGIPYVYSLHDHHAEYYGRGSFVYEQNLEAIRGSIFSITHAPHYIELFNVTDKLFYLPHGVEVDRFYTDVRSHNNSILMVANNGLAGDYSIDRKGFVLGIEVAKKYDIPITIVGAEANKRFFEIRKDLLDYDKLIVNTDNPTDDTILEEYRKHGYFLHPSSLEAGHPNLTLLEAAASQMKIVATYNGLLDIPNLFIIEKLDFTSVLDTFNKAWKTYYIQSVEHLSMINRLDWHHVVASLTKMYETALYQDIFESSVNTTFKLLNTYFNKNYIYDKI